jgi:hypothetical protein
MLESLFPVFIILWLLIAIVIVLHNWRRRHDGVGIVIVYTILFAVTHWLNAVITALPWYTSVYDTNLIKLGFSQALVGIIAFAIGTMFVGPMLWKQHFALTKPTANVDGIKGHQKLGILYLIVGLASYYFFFAYASNIGTLAAFAYSATLFIPVGIIILFCQAIKNQHQTIIVGLIAFMIAWPVYILMTQGFLSYGISFLIFTGTIIIRINRMPFKYFIALTIAAYFGASFAISYFGVRSEIRDIVWYGGQISTSQRFEAPALVLENYQLLNFMDEVHLNVFDARFPYNYFVGQSIENINIGIVDYSGGQTIVDSFLMLIPRAIWPEKPFRTGGDFLVAKYTGQDFYGDTTSQPTPVMEFYINFGTAGVVVGFIIFGAILAIVDKAAAYSIETNNLMAFAFWIVPAFTLLQAENGLISIIAGTVAGFLIAPVVNMILYNYLVMDERHQHSRVGLRPPRGKISEN